MVFVMHLIGTAAIMPPTGTTAVPLLSELMFWLIIFPVFQSCSLAGAVEATRSATPRIKAFIVPPSTASVTQGLGFCARVSWLPAPGRSNWGARDRRDVFRCGLEEVASDEWRAKSSRTPGFSPAPTKPTGNRGQTGSFLHSENLQSL